MFRKRLNINKIKNLIGETPLVKISDKIYAKLEMYNPSGSIKDRMVSHIIRRELIYGNISDETVLCEVTSGNTGISLSMMAASIGSSCVIFVPKDIPKERTRLMEVYGAKIIETPPGDYQGAINMRDAYLHANPNSWSMKQFSNSLNVDCHERNTAPEIHKQVIDLGKKWGAFVYGSGTGGTIEGIRKYLQYNNMKTKVCMVTPDKSAPGGIPGINSGNGFLTSREHMDRIIQISPSAALERTKEFAEKTGLLVGISSGANILAAERWVEENRPSGIVVTILSDSGERYLSLF